MRKQGGGFVCSFELGARVDVPLEGAVVDVGAVVVEVGHDGLVHAAIPLDVARLSVAVPVHVLVVLMEDWSLASAPLAMRIRHRWVLGENAGDCPVEQVRVVDESLGVEGMIVENNRAVVAKTTSDTADDEVADPAVGQPATNVEVLDGQFADHGEAEEHTKLRAGSIVGPVEIGLVSWASNDGKVIPGEPALKDLLIVEGLGCPFELSLLEGVFRDTETNEVTVLDVVSRLGVDSTSEFIVVGVLKAGEALGNLMG